MNKHLSYAWYVLRHKWYVGVECFRVGLYWRGLIHDWSKLLPSEWTPYVDCFYGEKGESPEFEKAWLQHQRRADHHWQWWLLLNDDNAGKAKALPMSEDARLEMICDWCGASKAQGHGGWPEVQKWYERKKEKIFLAHETETWVTIDLAMKAMTLLMKTGNMGVVVSLGVGGAVDKDHDGR